MKHLFSWGAGLMNQAFPNPAPSPLPAINIDGKAVADNGNGNKSVFVIPRISRITIIDGVREHARNFNREVLTWMKP